VRSREADIRTLAITMWGYHPALWDEAATKREKRRFIKRARYLLEQMDEAPRAGRQWAERKRQECIDEKQEQTTAKARKEAHRSLSKPTRQLWKRGSVMPMK